MLDPLRILIAGADARLPDEVRQCAAESRVAVAVQCLHDGGMALARLGGGDIDILIVDSDSLEDCGRGPGSLLERLRAACGSARTIVVAESRDWIAALRRALSAGPKLIGFLGAKGGVGVTTVALNAAAALAAGHPTVLAELGSGNDTLELHLRATASARARNLWSIKDVPGLLVALAQDTAAPETAVDTQYLVLDLGSALTPAVREILPRLDALALVVDLEISSVECARRVLSAIARPDLFPRGNIAVVVVNRAALACPFSADEVQRMVGRPVVGAVPSAADLCCAALKARRPLVTLDPESLAAQSLVRVALSLAELS